MHVQAVRQTHQRGHLQRYAVPHPPHQHSHSGVAGTSLSRGHLQSSQGAVTLTAKNESLQICIKVTLLQLSGLAGGTAGSAALPIPVTLLGN